MLRLSRYPQRSRKTAQRRLARHLATWSLHRRSTAPLYPREVLKEALRLNAASVIVSHNHPSGDPTASMADRSVTKKLKEALALIDVRLVDHVIVGGNSTYSFVEHGLLI